MQVNKDNWNHTFYNNNQLKAFISIGANVDEKEAYEPQIIYFVTVTDMEDQKQYFQRQFCDLNSALEFLQNRYGLWNFKDLKSNNLGGCSSCSAH